jgi:aldehyde dehydrogenase (NAD+)
MTDGDTSPLSDRDFLAAVEAPDRFFIGGEWVNPRSSERRTIVSPGSGRNFLSVALADGDDVDLAVSAARKAFDEGPWPQMTSLERAGYVARIGREIAARADRLGGLQSAEMGALHGAAVGSVPFFAQTFAAYAEIGESFPFVEAHASASDGASYLINEPVGVVGAIVPWNGPLMLACLKVAPALVAGCTIILKASPEAPTALLAMAEAIEAAGLPPGVFNLLTADREVSERLVRHPGVDKISFTGSTAAGQRIASICGERIARCSLELGGKSPAILLDDYDIELCAKAVAGSATMMTGQVCAALTRLIVPRAKQEAVIDAVAAQFAAVRVGDPFDPATEMGPLASARQCARVRDYVGRGQADGARLISGGSVPGGLDPQFYIAPTLFADVDNRHAIAQEEIFGPVLSIIAADSDDHAIAIANDSNFGLNSAVFTSDNDRAFDMARKLRAGTVGHNGFKVDFSISFGGFKQSGIGREGGIPGLRAYLEPKTVLLAGPPAHGF